ncbi:MlaE family ABC transporter permease [[Mycobacterium] burgundiense]|uniref:ABC transporter permease n=1 Tax=[Mycobacterium] burgundiense TaxID=3064286 RepID=A0ABM9LKF3_9MYCO|nr:ABC transporter permease [Mycolicibacterium sp. MU0053]CAJ1500523.1 ABC transporter permease [Mycolicibacterium sp. MU0053]
MTASTLLHTRIASMRVIRRPFREVGQWVVFIGETFWYLPLTVRKYTRETLRATISLSWGRGSLIVDGGTISVLLILGVAVGASVAVEALAVLNIIGFEGLAGLIGGISAVRVIGPLVAGIAFTAQAGTRMTAEIGSMRISEEIDALDAMGIRPIPFVVGTRLIGGMLCVLPGYLLTLVTTFLVLDTVVTVLHNEPGGTYDHYFIQFLTPADLTYSVIKAATYCIAATLIHCYYGYFASGGPVGVGQASGRAVRASLVTIMILDLTTTVLLWGLQPEYIFKG